VGLRQIALLFAPDLRVVLAHIDAALTELEHLEILAADDVAEAAEELRAARRLLSHP